MKDFKKVFGEQIAFTFVDGPFQSPQKPTEEMKKFLPADEIYFRHWAKYDLTADKKTPRIPPLVYVIEESVNYLIDILRQPQGPFDGVLTFSQGGIFFRHFYNITQKLDKESFTIQDKLTFPMPKFLVTIACPVFPSNLQKFLYKDKAYGQELDKQFNFPSVHLQGKSDPLRKYLTA